MLTFLEFSRSNTAATLPVKYGVWYDQQVNVRFQVLTAASMRLRIFWTSETSVDIQLRRRQYIPEDSESQQVNYL
jgi:hypothetical protein